MVVVPSVVAQSLLEYEARPPAANVRAAECKNLVKI
jgi:hypothetical protein